MTAQPIDLGEVARRVNVRLAEQAKPAAMPEVVGPARVSHVLWPGYQGGLRHGDLIREIAAEVEQEQAR